MNTIFFTHALLL